MSDAQQHVLDCIHQWVWSGYYSPDEVRTMIVDVLEPECDAGALQIAVGREFELKKADEASWPDVTDCDRLDILFFRLHERGICALGNAGYTMSDGYSDVAEVVGQAPADHYHGYCFYHAQDVERAVRGDGLMLAFGDLEDSNDGGLAVGRMVADTLSEDNFKIAWDGTLEQRINLPSFDWKRRAPPNFQEAVPEPLPATEKKWWEFWR